eukprot:COSAG05_NODE_4032_length_1707_cov_19.161692_1_plen_229_part_00
MGGSGHAELVRRIVRLCVLSILPIVLYFVIIFGVALPQPEQRMDPRSGDAPRARRPGGGGSEGSALVFPPPVVVAAGSVARWAGAAPSRKRPKPSSHRGLVAAVSAAPSSSPAPPTDTAPVGAMLRLPSLSWQEAIGLLRDPLQPCSGERPHRILDTVPIGSVAGLIFKDSTRKRASGGDQWRTRGVVRGTDAQSGTMDPSCKLSHGQVDIHGSDQKLHFQQYQYRHR